MSRATRLSVQGVGPFRPTAAGRRNVFHRAKAADILKLWNVQKSAVRRMVGKGASYLTQRMNRKVLMALPFALARHFMQNKWLWGQTIYMLVVMGGIGVWSMNSVEITKFIEQKFSNLMGRNLSGSYRTNDRYLSLPREADTRTGAIGAKSGFIPGSSTDLALIPRTTMEMGTVKVPYFKKMIGGRLVTINMRGRSTSEIQQYIDDPTWTASDKYLEHANIPEHVTHENTIAFHNKLHGDEWKLHDQAESSTLITTAGVIIDTVLPIPQGTADNNRVGRHVILTYLGLRVFFETASAAQEDSSGDFIRWIVYLDKQCNGTAAVVGDLLQNADPISFRNLDNVHRFHILHDKMFSWNSGKLTFTTIPTLHTQIRQTEHFGKKLSIPITFSGTAGTVADLSEYNIGMLFISTTNNHVTVTFRSRVLFKE